MSVIEELQLMNLGKYPKNPSTNFKGEAMSRAFYKAAFRKSTNKYR